MKKLLPLALLVGMVGCTPTPYVAPTAQPQPNVPYTDNVKIIKNTLACDSIGIFSIMDGYRRDGDNVAANRYKTLMMQLRHCKTLNTGTPVTFYHFSTYTEDDYGSYTTIRPKGSISHWVVDKCALNSRDPDLLRFPGYTVPEKPCP